MSGPRDAPVLASASDAALRFDGDMDAPAPASPSSSPSAEAATGARLRALEMLVAYLVADRLDEHPNPLAFADETLMRLMSKADDLPPHWSTAADEPSDRERLRFAIFDLMQMAVQRIGE